MTARVSQALEDDLEHVLDGLPGAGDVGVHVEVGLVCREGGVTSLAPVDGGEGADVRPHPVELHRHPRLQLGQLQLGVRRTLATEQLAGGLEAKVDPGETLRIVVMQGPSDVLALGALRVESCPLLSEEADQVAGHRQVRGPHEIEVSRLPCQEQDREGSRAAC